MCNLKEEPKISRNTFTYKVRAIYQAKNVEDYNTSSCCQVIVESRNRPYRYCKIFPSLASTIIQSSLLLPWNQVCNFNFKTQLKIQLVKMWFITAKWADVEKQVDSENLYTCTQVADLIKLVIFFLIKRSQENVTYFPPWNNWSMLLFFIMILDNCLLRSFIATLYFALVSRSESLNIYLFYNM